MLIFSKTEGYRHKSIPVAKQALVEFCRENGIKADTTENARYFVTDSLKRYSAVIFLSTTGNVLNIDQQQHFERYIQAGGGFVGIHAATDTEYKWPWYSKLVGAQFANHPKQQEAVINVIDRNHPSTSHLPEKWKRFDEWYNFKNIYGRINVLGNLDESSYEGGKNGENHPIMWYHEFDGGRSFYTALGHTDESYREEAFLKHVLGGIHYAIGDNALDYDEAHTQLRPSEDNYVKDVLIQGLDEPMELEIFDKGKVLFTERKGAVKLYDPVDKKVTTIAKINVNNTFEDGLMGLAKDPNYKNNHWIYMYYAPAGEEWVMNLSRFVFVADSILMDSEKILLQVPVQRATCCHTGGSIEFGPGGLLYLSTGDDTNPFNNRDLEYNSNGYGPMNEMPGYAYWDAQRSSSNTNDLRGKVLRIKPEPDGTYSIPDGNLFPKDGSKGRPEIFVMGCRNPYRISIDQKTGILYFGDVGPDANENSERGPKGHDEVNQVKEAGYYGWPLFIANNKPYADFDYATGEIGPKFDPEHPKNTSPNNTGMVDLPPARPAMIYYPYDITNEFEDLESGGRNAMAGPVYRSSGSRASRYKLSPYYEGKFFFYDWMRDWIMAATMDENNNMLYYEPFLPTIDFYNIMDMAISDDGVMYILEYGENWFSMNSDASLSRILYSEGNKLPVAVAKVDKQYATVPATLSFSAEDSYDFDMDDQLSYSWMLEDEELSTEMKMHHTFDEAGTYQLTLYVTDEHGEQTSDLIEVYVGNAYPAVNINFEGNKTFYWQGRSINYGVEVSDNEDGSYPGQGIAKDKIAFTIDYVASPDQTEAAAGHRTKADLLDGAQLLEEHNCYACHQIDEESNGPKYLDVAERYEERPRIIEMLIRKVINGGSGNWGERMMSANPNIPEDEVETMVKYILSLNDTEPQLPLDGTYFFDKHGELDQGNYLFKVSYTDQGGNGIKPLTTTKTFTFRSPVVEAENFSGIDNARPVDISPEGGMGIGRIDAGSNLRYDNIDLSGIKNVNFIYRSQADLSFELRQGSKEGNIVASGTLPETENLAKLNSLIFAVSGQKDTPESLFLIFTSDGGGRATAVDKFEFTF